ncbi:SMP-30/gluconolactonase/LRE family protein [Pseudoxanthobacter sp.]|uniref:SMP-30/gluconolactonase/LRE family protein n=1 Tax=Pseudoxanthobacter sp. TaxID=1925742 RepID=UPI002FE24D43
MTHVALDTLAMANPLAPASAPLGPFTTGPVLANPVDVLDDRALPLALPHAHLERVATGCRWAEGPVWFPLHNTLVWSDIPEDRMLYWRTDGSTGVFRAPSRHSNGNTRDPQGRLVTCEHGSRRVTRTEHDGSLTVIAERYDGRRLNSPNDVVVTRDGAIWFTDPIYGILSLYEGAPAEPEQPTRNVYRVDPHSGQIAIVADDFGQPNGLCFSPDERTLYIADSGRSHGFADGHHVRAFDVAEGRLRNGRVFAVIEPGVPDGMRVDARGNLWSSAADGVHVFAPDGSPIAKLRVPEAVANLTFGGPKGNRLFITATTSLYALYVGVSGAA